MYFGCTEVFHINMKINKFKNICGAVKNIIRLEIYRGETMLKIYNDKEVLTVLQRTT
jgi:hypothetical protein